MGDPILINYTLSGHSDRGASQDIMDRVHMYQSCKILEPQPFQSTWAQCNQPDWVLSSRLVPSQEPRFRLCLQVWHLVVAIPRSPLGDREPVLFGHVWLPFLPPWLLTSWANCACFRVAEELISSFPLDESSYLPGCLVPTLARGTPV
jgi:hypothetical protein